MFPQTKKIKGAPIFLNDFFKNEPLFQKWKFRFR
jgi:hypothetical protein